MKTAEATATAAASEKKKAEHAGKADAEVNDEEEELDPATAAAEGKKGAAVEGKDPSSSPIADEMDAGEALRALEEATEIFIPEPDNSHMYNPDFVAKKGKKDNGAAASRKNSVVDQLELDAEDVENEDHEAEKKKDGEKNEEEELDGEKVSLEEVQEQIEKDLAALEVAAIAGAVPLAPSKGA